MKLKDLVTCMKTQWAMPNGHRVPFLTIGPPGCGKTAAARLGCPDHIPEDRRVTMWASLLDTCDFMGLPELSGDHVRWIPPALFWNIRAGTGPAFLLLDEGLDATMPVQNVMSALILERRIGDLFLTDELYIVMTGNRTTDKSGANRLSTKVANRLCIIDFDADLDGWVHDFALPHNLPGWLVQFLRFRPGLFNDFDPSRMQNPTSRSWSQAALIPDFPNHEGIYFEALKGHVGEGAAAEAVAFRRIVDNLPDIDKDILAKPKTAKVPTDPAVLYAITGALARKATVATIDDVITYARRLPPEFNVLTVKDIIVLTPALARTSAFTAWASDHMEVLF